jgi:hexokinase
MPDLLLKRFRRRRVTIIPDPDDHRDSGHTSAANSDRCWYKDPMFDFWQGLLAALERIAMLPSLLQAVLPSLSSRRRTREALRTYDRTMDDLLHEVQRLLEAPLEAAKLQQMSAALQEQFAPKLQASDICMLPSYNHTLPTGRERGTYLALDVGGSTFRIALVELNGKQVDAKHMRIVTMKSYSINEKVRQRSGTEFFDWMAEKIEQALADPQLKKANGTKSFPMGLAWSFPVEYVTLSIAEDLLANRLSRQTSTRSANLLDMGKGFRATEGVLGQDLSELIMTPCRKRVSFARNNLNPASH